mmetsp:Transcript_78125/g.173165  ORF Transcript_78125/g.173165 Transcript_78125/m.173165 type:complete len:360 (-) Transcript_78125:227-1306(-)
MYALQYVSHDHAILLSGQNAFVAIHVDAALGEQVLQEGLEATHIQGRARHLQEHGPNVRVVMRGDRSVLVAVLMSGIVASGVAAPRIVGVPVLVGGFGVAVTMLLVPVTVFLAVAMLLVAVAVVVSLLGGRRCREVRNLALVLEEARGVEGVNGQELLDRQCVRGLGQAALLDGHQCVHTPDGVARLPEACWVHRIHLIQQHLVSEGNLLCRLVHGVRWPLTIQLLQEVHGVDHGDDAVDLAMGIHYGIVAEAFANGPRVGDASSLDQDPVDHGIWDPSFQALLHRLHDVLESFHEVVPHGAAETTVVQDGDGLHRLLLAHCLVHQHLVDWHCAQLILDHRVSLPMLRAEDIIEEGRLA